MPAGLGQLDLGSAASAVSDLPAAGDLNGQLTAGQNLMQTINSVAAGIQSGNPNAGQIAALLQQGVVLSNNLTSSSSLGTIARDVMQIGAATAAGATGGPWGAAAGFVVSSLEVLFQALFASPPGGQVSYNPYEPTQGSVRLYNLVKDWGQMSQHLGGVTGLPVGQSFYNYISQKYPPSQTPSSQQGQLWGQVLDNIYWASGSGTGGNLGPGQGGDILKFESVTGAYLTANSTDKQSLAFYYFSGNYQEYGPCSASYNQPFAAKCVKWNSGLSPQDAYMKLVQPLATAVFWNWAEPQNIVGVENNEFFNNVSGKVAGGRSDSDRYSTWQGDTVPIQGKNGTVIGVQQIMDYALANRPPPWFYAADLYALQTQGRNQIYGNCAAMSGVATVCGILAAGGSLQSVVWELLFQQKILHQLDGQVPGMFRNLVEYYLAKAKAELTTNAASATLSQASSSSSFWGTTGGKFAAVGLGVTGALLAYSAYTKQSPVTVVKTVGERARSKIRGG